MSDVNWFHDQTADEEEKQMQRCYWRRLAIVVVLAGIVLYALLGVRNAFADDFIAAKDGSVKLVRHLTPCEDADIIAHLLKMGAGSRLGEFKKSTLTYGGRTWRSCWIDFGGLVYSVDEEGEMLEPIPAEMFKPVGPDA